MKRKVCLTLLMFLYLLYFSCNIVPSNSEISADLKRYENVFYAYSSRQIRDLNVESIDNSKIRIVLHAEGLESNVVRRICKNSIYRSMIELFNHKDYNFYKKLYTNFSYEFIIFATGNPIIDTIRINKIEADSLIKNKTKIFNDNHNDLLLLQTFRSLAPKNQNNNISLDLDNEKFLIYTEKIDLNLDRINYSKINKNTLKKMFLKEINNEAISYLKSYFHIKGLKLIFTDRSNNVISEIQYLADEI